MTGIEKKRILIKGRGRKEGAETVREDEDAWGPRSSGEYRPQVKLRKGLFD